MWDRLQKIEQKYEDLSHKLCQPEVVNNQKLFREASKEHKSLEETVLSYKEYRRVKQDLENGRELLRSSDPEMRLMAQEEVTQLTTQLNELEERLKILLLPTDPNDFKNIILEIRAGAGGDEAGIFVGDLFRAYSKYAEERRWKVDLMSASEASAGGYKEVIATISGEGAYSRFKHESGVHRVQRVPKTEASGRTHTSTVTVAILPEAEDVDLEINEKDLRIEVYRSGGAGGQSVNTTDSAVRITHIPTGVVVAMQDERSQHKNRAKAMKVLRSRILAAKQAEADADRTANRRSQVGTGDRSERIRTYNYSQSRVTDHRIGLTLHNLPEIMEGKIDPIVQALIAESQARALRAEIGVPEPERMLADSDD